MKNRAYSKNFWDPKIYAKFLEARTKPARDLLSTIPQDAKPNLIYDLGCGTGNSTILLQSRWPSAKVIGLDSSEKMLTIAKSRHPEIEFILSDINHFSINEKSDLIFANASLQWIDNHEALIPKLISQLNHQGILAIQMPNNFHCPSHQITLNILQNHLSWQSLLKKLRYNVLDSPLYKIHDYYNLLTKSGLTHLQLWQTEYYQVMENHYAIFEWASGTGLRPILSNMDETDKTLFAKKYVEQLTTAYPLQKNGKLLFPFKRIFMMGHINEK